MGLLVRIIFLEDRDDKIHNGAILFSPSSCLFLSLRSKYHLIAVHFQGTQHKRTVDDNYDDDNNNNNNNNNN